MPLQLRRHGVDIALLLVVNSMWAAQYAAYKTASEAMGPATVSVWVFLLASLVLFPFHAWERRFRPSKPEMRGFSRQDVPEFLMVGVIGLVPSSACLAWGTALSTASNAALIYLTIPVMTALLASAMLGERMTGLRWISLAVSLVGVLILSVPDLRQASFFSPRYLAGNGLVLVACGSSAFYNVYSKKLLRRFTPLEVLIYGYLVAAMLSLPLAVWVEKASLPAAFSLNAKTWISIVVLASISWGIAMVLWMFLLLRLDVSQISVSIYLLPFLGVLIAAITLGERISVTTVVGGLITLIGTIVITAAEGGQT